MDRTTTLPNRKAKKSYTLSHESVAFLETMREKQHASSISSILEEIIQAVRREQERKALDGAISRYYSSLSETEAHEQTEWGSFAEREFPAEGHS